METLGHSQISLTLDTYSHVMPDLQAEAATQIDAALRFGFPNGFQAGEGSSEGAPESPNSEEILVSRGGIEPPTRRLRVCCSAN
jgi:hypothetical protein